MTHEKEALERNLRDDLVDWDELQKKLDSIPLIYGDTSVSYSGGLDSTVVAYLAGLKTPGRLHLMTMIHNYGSLFNHWAGRHVVDLKRIHGDKRVIHRYVNHSDVFQELTLKTLLPDLVKYGHFVWCLGCNLSLMTKVIINNLLYSIPNHLYCSSVGGQYAVMSMSMTHDEWKKLYAEYGIRFQTPLLDADIAKGEERAVMERAGIWVGYRFRRGVHGVQPICIPGFQHILDVLVDFHTTYDPDKVQKYIRSRWPMMKAIVAEFFRQRNLPLDELIQRNMRQYEAAEKLIAAKTAKPERTETQPAVKVEAIEVTPAKAETQPAVKAEVIEVTPAKAETQPAVKAETIEVAPAKAEPTPKKEPKSKPVKKKHSGKKTRSHKKDEQKKSTLAKKTRRKKGSGKRSPAKRKPKDRQGKKTE